MKKVVLSFLFLSVTSLMFAQTKLPNQCSSFYPSVLLESTVLLESDTYNLVKSGTYGQDVKPRVLKHWIAYSDRDDNPTYSSPSTSSEVFKRLQFNEKVIIAKIQNGFALIYSEPQKDIAYPKLSQFVESKGWIPMNKLLLWHSCPANNAGIYNKALLCVNLDDAGAKSGKQGRLYLNPKVMTKYKTLVTDMNFYFIMKREGKMVLLATQHSLEGKTDQVLHGWVEENSYVAWNQRSCLEPTWKKSDVNYFADKNIHADIFSEKKSTGETSKSTPVSYFPFVKQAENGDKYQYRMAPNSLRFPILDDGTSTLYNCSTFGATGDAKETDMTKYIVEEDERIKKADKAISELAHINVGIVIDGTRSMDAFFPAVKEAIKEAFSSHTENIKVGVVIYRDYADGEYATEICQMTDPRNPKLAKFLDDGGNYGVTSSKNDISLSEAVFTGINTALDNLKFNPSQSNLLFVVGDCGNDREDRRISEATIVNKLVSKKIHFMGFQVRNNANDAFSLFNSQILNIMKQSMQKKYDELTEGANRTIVKAVRDVGGYTIQNSYQNGLYIGSHRYAQQGKEMRSDELKTLVLQAINDCNEVAEKQMKAIHDVVTKKNDTHGMGKSTAVNGQLAIDEAFVRKRLGDIAGDDTDGKLLSFKGWTPKKVDNRNIYQPVVFISSDEFTTLLARLEPIKRTVAEESNNREPYINALKNLIRTLVPDITDEEMNAKGYNEVMRMIAGLNEASSALKGPSITDIASKEIVSHSEYMSLIIDFNNKYEKLERIKSSAYKYVRQFNGIKYYWIPIEDLP